MGAYLKGCAPISKKNLKNTHKMVYLNNSATSYPKPKKVIDAVCLALESPPENQFRSGSIGDGSNPIITLKENLGKLFSIKENSRIFLSSGATDCINRVFYGLDLEGLPLVITSTEHNSVLRPLFNSEKLRSNLHIVDADSFGGVHLEDIEKVLEQTSKRKTSNSLYKGLLVVNHCSNVTGRVQDAKAISQIAKKYGFLFMLDASQSAGSLEIDVDAWGIDIMVFTGHKALFSPQGIGGYYVKKGVYFKPMLFGGTGKDSSKLLYSGQDDFEYEVGTQNMVGIQGLNAGVEYILEKTIESISLHEYEMMRHLYKELEKNPKIKVYGSIQENIGPLLSFNIVDMKPTDVGYILQNAYDITVRTGLHCSPLIHRSIGTYPLGTIRVSVSALTLKSDIETFLQAIYEISNA